MALRNSLNSFKSMASRLKGNSATYTTATSPKTASYTPTADLHHHHQTKKGGVKGDFVPVYVAIGMIAVSVSLGLFTVKHQILYSPNVRVKKKVRETVPEVEDPDLVVDEADKFLKKSLFRKIAHIQEFENGLSYMPNTVHGDAFAHQPHVETLKSVGVDPKAH
ncbi:uncharacterized protein [Euphorbia lathyris]|uniref:uncharacterized protein n=1 Tax=Euphorbia lathyris TaxID=212925 RepID=UPI003313980A